jgi:hypothetical protein
MYVILNKVNQIVVMRYHSGNILGRKLNHPVKDSQSVYAGQARTTF